MGILSKDLSREADTLYRRLGRFRLSDRQALLQALETPSGQRDTLAALLRYVEKWDQSTWIEDYSVERIGKWLVKYASPLFVDEVLKRASTWRAKKGSVALANGIEVGRKAAGISSNAAGPAST